MPPSALDELSASSRARPSTLPRRALTPSSCSPAAQLDVELPINFEITNPANVELNTHAGVLEFIADEGCVNLPQWVRPLPPSSSPRLVSSRLAHRLMPSYPRSQMMDQLRLNEGDPVRLVGGRYPKGKMIKIQPQSVDFLEISDPKAVCVFPSLSRSLLLVVPVLLLTQLKRPTGSSAP